MALLIGSGAFEELPAFGKDLDGTGAIELL
jgi:hypothetical protein